MYQLTALNTIVTLQVAQQLAFSLTASYKVYIPTQYVSFRDFSYGVPAFILCWETLIFSGFFFQAFHYGEYRAAAQQGTQRAATVSSALWNTIDISDIIRGSFFMVTILVPCIARKSPVWNEKSGRDLPMVEEGMPIDARDDA